MMSRWYIQSQYAVQVCCDMTLLAVLYRLYSTQAVESIHQLLHKCTVLFSLALNTTFASTQTESKAGWTGLGV